MSVQYCRFQAGDSIAYGIVEGETVIELDGDLFGQWRKSDRAHRLASVKLLAPCQPRQIFATAGNYRSHLGGEVPEKFQIPQIFYKPPSCIIGPGEDIVIPPGTNDVHYEAELVLIIGKRTKNVSESEALGYVLGATAGNDVSARDWQKNDVQWWRGKGSDTFGPLGPFIVSGIDFDNLRIQLRLNGKTMQDCNSKELIQSSAKIISFISKHVTLLPGDAIFTGTSGTTTAMKPGDRVEVEIDRIGLLMNSVRAD